jgi:transcriptional regulator with XRE-family HTH domain
MIKDYRLLRGLTQEQLAEKLEISTRQLQRIENEESEISMKIFRKLVITLQINNNDIIKFIKK